MTQAWIHILIVHIPVLGSFLVVFLGIRAIQTTQVAAYKTFYWSSFFIAITASIAYFSGPETATWVQDHMTHFSKEIIENHALWGRIGFSVAVLSGLVGIMAIANYAQEEKPHKSIPWILLGISVMVFLIFLYTAHLGGSIRRPDLV